MRYLGFVLLSAVGVCLSGCSMFGHHSNDYLKSSQNESPLIVPKSVPPIKQQPYYVIPKISRSVAAKPISEVPPTLLKK